jgi:hypothetical protein
MLPSDVIERIHRDFPAADARAAATALDQLQEYEPEVFSLRLIRCAVHLSQGEYLALGEWIVKARGDWRDVVRAAEFDRGDRRLRNFDQPFEPEPAKAR